MTSLKVQYANEIAEAMAKTLGDEEFMGLFKKASIQKEAGGKALEAYKADLAKAQDKNGLTTTWNKHMDALNQEESTDEARKLQADKARALKLPGYAAPADDVAFADAPYEQEAQEVIDPVREKAADFALAHLVKVADALDNHGFVNIASIVDEAMAKIAKKKSKKEEEEEDKKSKKSKKEEEDKKSKKSKKEEEDKKSKKSK